MLPSVKALEPIEMKLSGRGRFGREYSLTWRSKPRTKNGLDLEFWIHHYPDRNGTEFNFALTPAGADRSVIGVTHNVTNGRIEIESNNPQFGDTPENQIKVRAFLKHASSLLKRTEFDAEEGRHWEAALNNIRDAYRKISSK